jgi:hypothetical protein
MRHSKIYFIALLCLLFFADAAKAQDLLDLVDTDKPKKEIVKNAFKSIRVINGHSIEFLSPGTMDFRILHRFGQLNQPNNFIGLDQASMRLGFDFGITRYLQFGFGRSTFKKEIDGYIKLAPIRQSTGTHSFPATIAFVGGMTLNTLPYADPTVHNYFSSRIAYYGQMIIGRKFSEGITLQLSPTIVHNNIVPFASQPNDVYAIGFGGRLKMNKRTAFTWDYYYLINGIQKDIGNVPINYNPLSIGVDIETGGHVFQLHVSNSAGMNERAFITETTGSWEKFDVRLGFNLSRIFQISHKK